MPLIDPVTMASQVAKTSAPGQAGDSTPELQPIHVLNTPAASAVRHLQPAFLLALFIYQFNSMVADPVRTMQNSLPLVAAIQTLYVFACLPVAGSQAAKSIKKLRPGEKKKVENTGPNPFVAIFLSLVLTALLTPVLHATFVLFGAPFLTHIPHTLLCSANLSLLSLFPLFYVHGVDAKAWVAVAGGLAPLDEAFGGLMGGFLGAWLGAVPIPLDWDREWQKWPVTILCGLYGGCIIGKLVGGTVAHGKRMGGSSIKAD